MTERNIFLASSPRHLLLFSGLALDLEAHAENRLYFIEHVPAATVATYLDTVERWSASPFGHVEALRSDHRSVLAAQAADGRLTRRSLKRRFRRENRAVLDAALAACPADAVYLGVDDCYEAQYLLHRSRQRNPARRGVYVEDGVSCYAHSYQQLHIRNIPKEWGRALRYFPWWRPSPLTGASSWLTEGYVAFPELVLEPFRRKRLAPLPRDRFLSPEFRALAALMAQEFGVDVPRLAGADVLIAVTHSSWALKLPRYRETMRRICRELLAAGKRVAIKPHPRDPEQNLLELDDDPNLYRVPGGVMFEVLAILLDKPDLLVVGDASTALAASKWLRPEAEVLALRHAPNGIDGNYLGELFAATDVRVMTDAAALMRHCIERVPAAARAAGADSGTAAGTDSGAAPGAAAGAA
jgi:hypothetical protein